MVRNEKSKSQKGYKYAQVACSNRNNCFCYNNQV